MTDSAPLISPDNNPDLNTIILNIDTLIAKNEAITDQPVRYSKLLFTYATRSDKILLFIGFFGAFMSGLGLPTFTFLFGDVINAFAPSIDGANDPNDYFVDKENALAALRKIAIEFLIIGVVMFVTSYLYFAFLQMFAERVGARTRVAYLQAILRQDISWFDRINA